jgi:hypothetical protein
LLLLLLLLLLCASVRSGTIALGGTLAYILSFAIGAGPVSGLIVPEINKEAVRGEQLVIGFVTLLLHALLCDMHVWLASNQLAGSQPQLQMYVYLSGMMLPHDEAADIQFNYTTATF